MRHTEGRDVCGGFILSQSIPRQIKREVKKVERCKRGKEMACKVWGNRKDDYKLIERVRGEIDGSR